MKSFLLGFCASAFVTHLINKNVAEVFRWGVACVAAFFVAISRDEPRR